MVACDPQGSMCWKCLPQLGDVAKLWHLIGGHLGPLPLEEHDVGFVES